MVSILLTTMETGLTTSLQRNTRYNLRRFHFFCNSRSFQVVECRVDPK
jgi:hypothetical protein